MVHRGSYRRHVPVYANPNLAWNEHVIRVGKRKYMSLNGKLKAHPTVCERVYLCTHKQAAMRLGFSVIGEWQNGEEPPIKV
jgi:hypothetical protein